MSVILSSSCTDNGSVSRLSNGLQDASITASSSKTLLSNIEQGRRNKTNSFRSSSAWTDNNREWDKFFQQSAVHDNGNQEFTNFFISEDEEEEEFRQEWSDEHFTQLYAQQQHSLSLDKLHNRKQRLSTSQNSFVQEFLQNSDDNNQKMTTMFCTNHCDLFQAQLYLIDHLLSTILTCPITSTHRPSSTAEWNWDRLFSPTRWYDKGEDEDHEDNILQNEYLKHVTIGRLQLLLGHLIVNNDDDKRKDEWEWEWEFYNS